MKAVYENDTVRGAGYGLFRLEDTGAAAEGAQYGLVRSGDYKSLHPGGWEDTEYRLTPDVAKVEGSAVCLSVGPDVVNRLDALTTYRLLFYPATGPAQKAVLELGAIVYAPTAGAANVAGAARQEAAPAPEPVPAPRQEAAPEPPLDMTPSPVGASAPILPPPMRREAPHWLVALVVIALLVGAGFFVKKKFFSPDKPVIETPALPAEPGEPAAPEPQTQTGESPRPSALSPLDQARGFLRGNGSGDEAFSLGNTLAEDAEGRDAAFLLMEYAAEKGQGDAMISLAGFYDPSRDIKRGSIVPDAEQAWTWYGKAEQAGKAEGKERRAALKAWLEDEASKGSAEARDALLRLQ